nr:citrate/2-methylcitrate synthase [Kribbella shirazensis]
MTQKSFRRDGTQSSSPKVRRSRVGHQAQRPREEHTRVPVRDHQRPPELFLHRRPEDHPEHDRRDREVQLAHEEPGHPDQERHQHLVPGAGQRVHTEAREDQDPAAAAHRLVASYKARKANVPGFGHRFHPRDPRRDPLIAAAQQAVADGTISRRYLEVALAPEAALAPIPMNVDGATATIYAELGLPAELARGLFILSRSVGLLAHAREQQEQPTRIKGPLPKAVIPTYTGHPPRSL